MKYTIHYTNGKTYTIKSEPGSILSLFYTKDIDFVSTVSYRYVDYLNKYSKSVTVYTSNMCGGVSSRIKLCEKVPSHLRKPNPKSKTKKQIREEEQDKQRLAHKVAFNTTPSPEDMVCTNKDYSFWLGNVEDRGDD